MSVVAYTLLASALLASVELLDYHLFFSMAQSGAETAGAVLLLGWVQLLDHALVMQVTAVDALLGVKRLHGLLVRDGLLTRH